MGYGYLITKIDLVVTNDHTILISDMTTDPIMKRGLKQSNY